MSMHSFATSSRIRLALLTVLVLAFPFVASQFGNSWVRIADIALLYIMLALGLARIAACSASSFARSSSA